jgi:TonB-linked SusC/RagA family outer membrane protein
MACLGANAQDLIVHGTVISASDKEPLIGATVKEKGINNATVTDLSGNFSLKVKNAATLIFSYVGFQMKEVKASANMNVTMKDEANNLNEIVITGYTSQRKADLTGAVAVVNVKETKTVPVTDPMQALQGKVAGMTITNSGDPASDATIQIRGIGTMNDNSPLYVIDGVPTKNSLHSLNANDIESIQVLKDAASASIYGSRAGNGVIIITTKRGKSGNVKIDFDMSYTASYYASHMKVCNTEQYGEAMFRAYTNSSVDPNSNALSYAFNWNKDYTNPVLNSMSFGKYDGYIDAEKTMLASNTNWFDEISRVGSLQNYSVSISNGTDKGSYLFSVGYKGDEGIIKYTDYNSISARMNSSYNLINNKATIGENSQHPIILLLIRTNRILHYKLYLLYLFILWTVMDGVDLQMV